jgi:hypothetical protein
MCRAQLEDKYKYLFQQISSANGADQKKLALLLYDLIHVRTYSQYFVLSDKREGHTVTCQAKKMRNPHYRCGIQLVLFYTSASISLCQ